MSHWRHWNGESTNSSQRPQAARDHLVGLVAVNLVLIPAAILTYGEPFRFWQLPLSDLGVPWTRNGQPNFVSFTLFAVNMAIGAIVMASLAVTCIRSRTVAYRRVKSGLAILASAGFVVGTVPHDPFHYVHLAGCASMVGSLWFLGNLFSLELVTSGRRRAAAATQAVLHLTVLPYAAAYFAGSDSKQVLQKIAVFGLFATLTLATESLCADRRPGVLQAGRPQEV